MGVSDPVRETEVEPTGPIPPYEPASPEQPVHEPTPEPAKEPVKEPA